MKLSKHVVILHSLCVALILITLASLSEAADKQKAKAHFASGKALMKVDNFDGAALEFEASIANYPTKNALFNLAQCYRALSKYAEALDALDRLAKDFGDSMSRPMKTAVDEILNEIESLAANLKVQVDRPGATISVNGKVVGESPLANPLVLAPGRHEVEVSLSGYETERRRVSLMSKDNKEESFALKAEEQNVPVPVDKEPDVPEEKSTAPLELTPETERSGATLSVWSWSGIGITGAFVVATAVVGGIYLHNGIEGTGYIDKMKKDPDSSSYDDWQEKMEMHRDKTKALMPATIGLVAATAALAVATTVLVVLDVKKSKKHKQNSNSARWIFAPGALGLTF